MRPAFSPATPQMLGCAAPPGLPFAGNSCQFASILAHFEADREPAGSAFGDRIPGETIPSCA